MACGAIWIKQFNETPDDTFAAQGKKELIILGATSERFPRPNGLLVATGPSAAQRRELQETTSRTPCDLALVATPVDLARLLRLNKPSLRVEYEIA
jgi:predicted GTPase